MRTLLITLTVIGVTLGVYFALNLDAPESHESGEEGAVPTPS